jgi:hypothetical protein
VRCSAIFRYYSYNGRALVAADVRRLCEDTVALHLTEAQKVAANHVRNNPTIRGDLRAGAALSREASVEILTHVLLGGQQRLEKTAWERALNLQLLPELHHLLRHRLA